MFTVEFVVAVKPFCSTGLVTDQLKLALLVRSVKKNSAQFIYCHESEGISKTFVECCGLNLDPTGITHDAHHHGLVGLLS